MTIGIIFISLLFMVIGMIVQFTLKSKFNTYSKIPTTSGLSGKEVAEKMLRDNGIYDVQITSVEGMLSDHYDPVKTAYSMLMLRSRLVPIVQISSNMAQWVILIGLGMFSFGGGSQTILLIGIVLFAISTLFAVITLPVEFDASLRALKWLDTTNITTPAEHEKAKDALKWAALTYVVAALASIAMLVQYILIYKNRN